MSKTKWVSETTDTITALSKNELESIEED